MNRQVLADALAELDNDPRTPRLTYAERANLVLEFIADDSGCSCGSRWHKGMRRHNVDECALYNAPRRVVSDPIVYSLTHRS